MRKALILGAFLGLVYIFTYTGLGLAVSYVMRDYQAPDRSSFSALEVTTNDGGTQHKQTYNEQPALNVQAQ